MVLPSAVLVVAELTEPAATRLSCTADVDAEEVHHLDLEATASPQASFLGLLAETEYRCALAVPGQGTLASTGVRTGAWVDVPDLSVSGDPSAMDGVYTMFNTGPICDTDTSQQVWIVDPEGRVRWGYTMPEVATADLDARYLGGDRVSIGGGKGVPGRGDGVVRELGLGGELYYERSVPVSGDDYTHSAEILDTGELLSLVWQTNTGASGNFWGFGVERLDRATGLPTWEWNSQAALDAGFLTAGSPGTDWYHANTVLNFVDDPEGPSYWVNLAQSRLILRIGLVDDEVSWAMGPGGDFRLLDATGAELGDESWFEFQHAISVEPDGEHLLLHVHDNAYSSGSSRLLDLQVDLAARTAQVVWEWTEPGWVERAGGDHDVLPGGHRLATQGHCSCCDASGDRASSVTEIDPTDGAVVWRLTVEGDSEYLYRSERMDGCEVFANAKYCAELGE